MSYKLKLSDKAQKELNEFVKSGKKVTIKKIYKFFEELREHPYRGTGKPEPLKHNFSGMWSRRIDAKNRMVYLVEDEIITVQIISLKGHYTDK